MGRITIDGERVEFSTKLEINPDTWDEKPGRAKGNSASIANLNRILSHIRDKASSHYNRLMDENGYVLPDKIKNASFGLEEKGKTIMFYFDKFNARYKWIMSKRHKTEVPYKVRLLDIPMAIMNKYEGKQEDGKILPVISNQKMNSYLHEIASICCIDKNITLLPNICYPLSYRRYAD